MEDSLLFAASSSHVMIYVDVYELVCNGDIDIVLDIIMDDEEPIYQELPLLPPHLA